MNRKYMTVSTDETNNDGCGLHQYNTRQSFDSFEADVPSFQWQPIEQMKYHNNQNQRPPSGQAQSVQKAAVEGSPIYTSPTQSISILKPNEASNIQKKQQNKQHEYAGQRSGISLSNEFGSHNVTFCCCSTAQE
jgi:hypothetical protein